MIQRGLVFIFTIFIGTISLFAETTDNRQLMPHELRVGWGDQLFETLIWHKPTHIVTSMPDSYRQTYNEDYQYIQHLWVEYHNRYNSWFSYGAMIDGSGVQWSEVTRNGAGQEINRENGHYFYNLVFMPTIRFTYFNHEYVNLYSQLGFGMDINGGTETNYLGRKTDVGAAANIILIGLSANYDRWFATLDLGGLYALRDTATIFLASSKIISIAVGVRF